MDLHVGRFIENANGLQRAYVPSTNYVLIDVRRSIMGNQSSELLKACRDGRSEDVSRLLKNGTSAIGVRTKGAFQEKRGFSPIKTYRVVGSGKSCLELAIERCHVETVIVLLDEGGVDPNEIFKRDRWAESAFWPAQWEDDW